MLKASRPESGATRAVNRSSGTWFILSPSDEVAGLSPECLRPGGRSVGCLRDGCPSAHRQPAAPVATRVLRLHVEAMESGGRDVSNRASSRTVSCHLWSVIVVGSCRRLGVGSAAWLRRSAVVRRFEPPAPERHRPFIDDLYLSGTTFFTLGLGDVQPVG